MASLAIAPRNCKHCREPFTPRRKWQDFCGEKCRVRFYVELKEEDDRRREELLDILTLDNENLELQVLFLETLVRKLT